MKLGRAALCAWALTACGGSDADPGPLRVSQTPGPLPSPPESAAVGPVLTAGQRPMLAPGVAWGSLTWTSAVPLLRPFQPVKALYGLIGSRRQRTLLLLLSDSPVACQAYTQGHLRPHAQEALIELFVGGPEGGTAPSGHDRHFTIGSYLAPGAHAKFRLRRLDGRCRPRVDLDGSERQATAGSVALAALPAADAAVPGGLVGSLAVSLQDGDDDVPIAVSFAAAPCPALARAFVATSLTQPADFSCASP